MNTNNQEIKPDSDPEKQTTAPHSTDHISYPKLDPNDVAPPPPENWTSVPVTSQPPPVEAPRSSAPPQGGAATTLPVESNPYVSPAPVPPSTMKSECLFSINLVLSGSENFINLSSL